MASSSKGATRFWPGFKLNWLSRAAGPTSARDRAFQEYIAGIGMIQVNEQRRKENQPPFQYATILTGIHQSESDHFPHATLAAATGAMRDAGEHIVVHACVSHAEPEAAKFVGSEAYIRNVRKDSASLRDSYHNPTPARASLVSSNDTDIPVGHNIIDGYSQWYIVDEVTERLVYIELKAFFRAGEGNNEHIKFWNPLKKTICRAIFFGNERPQPQSPEPQGLNLEAAISDLNISVTPTKEWVKPQLKLDKKTSRPLIFATQANQDIRTGWDGWEAKRDSQVRLFLFVEQTSGKEYWAESLPGEWVQLAWETSGDKPIRFCNSAGDVLFTKEAKWLSGKANSFYVYMKQGIVYLTESLPIPT